MLIKRWFWILFFLIIIFQSSCGKKTSFKDLEERTSEIKNVKAKKYQSNTITTLQMPSSTTYQMASMKSPFKANAPNLPTTQVSSNPLLTYSINMLRFVGTLTSGHKTLAYILAPNNLVYTVQEGDPIGLKGGAVFRISPKLLSIRELDIENGKRIKRVITLELKDKQ